MTRPELLQELAEIPEGAAIVADEVRWFAGRDVAEEDVRAVLSTLAGLRHVFETRLAVRRLHAGGEA